VTRTLLRLLSLLYRYGVRPLVPGGAGGRTCRYEPTCSRYAADAVLQHGWFKGSGLALWRVMRCNPWSHGGYDPVPPAGPAPVPPVGDAPGRDRATPVGPASSPLTRDTA
jgi:uncharacterized protein